MQIIPAKLILMEILSVLNRTVWTVPRGVGKYIYTTAYLKAYSLLNHIIMLPDYQNIIFGYT